MSPDLGAALGAGLAGVAGLAGLALGVGGGVGLGVGSGLGRVAFGLAPGLGPGLGLGLGGRVGLGRGRLGLLGRVDARHAVGRLGLGRRRPAQGPGVGGDLVDLLEAELVLPREHPVLGPVEHDADDLRALVAVDRELVGQVGTDEAAAVHRVAGDAADLEDRLTGRDEGGVLGHRLELVLARELRRRVGLPPGGHVVGPALGRELAGAEVVVGDVDNRDRDRQVEPVDPPLRQRVVEFLDPVVVVIEQLVGWCGHVRVRS